MWCVICDLWQDMWYVFLYQVHKLHKCVSSKGLIQLWNVGQLKSDSARWSFVMFPFSRLYLYCRKQNVPTSLNSTDLASFWIFASNEGFLQPNNMLCKICCDSWISLSTNQFQTGKYQGLLASRQVVHLTADALQQFLSKLHEMTLNFSSVVNCITFENSCNPPSVKVMLCKHGKSALLLL